MRNNIPIQGQLAEIRQRLEKVNQTLVSSSCFPTSQNSSFSSLKNKNSNIDNLDAKYNHSKKFTSNNLMKNIYQNHNIKSEPDSDSSDDLSFSKALQNIKTLHMTAKHEFYKCDFHSDSDSSSSNDDFLNSMQIKYLNKYQYKKNNIYPSHFIYDSDDSSSSSDFSEDPYYKFHYNHLRSPHHQHFNHHPIHSKKYFQQSFDSFSSDSDESFSYFSNPPKYHSNANSPKIIHRKMHLISSNSEKDKQKEISDKSKNHDSINTKQSQQSIHFQHSSDLISEKEELSYNSCISDDKYEKTFSPIAKKNPESYFSSNISSENQFRNKSFDQDSFINIKKNISNEKDKIDEEEFINESVSGDFSSQINSETDDFDIDSYLDFRKKEEMKKKSLLNEKNKTTNNDIIDIDLILNERKERMKNSKIVMSKSFSNFKGSHLDQQIEKDINSIHDNDEEIPNLEISSVSYNDEEENQIDTTSGKHFQNEEDLSTNIIPPAVNEEEESGEFDPDAFLATWRQNYKKEVSDDI